jgi:hypothetical protein
MSVWQWACDLRSSGAQLRDLAAVGFIQHSLRLLWHDEARRHFYC